MPMKTQRQPKAPATSAASPGPNEGRQHPGGRERGEDRRLQAARVDQADDDVQPDGERTAAQALEDAARDQHLHARRGAAAPGARARTAPSRPATGPRGPARSLHMPAPTIPTTPLARGAAKESA